MSRRNEAPQRASIPVTLTIPAELLAELDAHAAAEQRSRSNAAAVLLARALADLRKAG